MQSQPKIANAKWLPISIVFIIPFIVYIGSISNGFVYDDNNQILNNPWIVNFDSIFKIFSSSAWSFDQYVKGSNFYRPLMHLTFMGEYQLFGFKPWGYHLINTIFHSINSVLVFLTASFVFRRLNTEGEMRQEEPNMGTVPALPSALIFAVHPINSEVANWVSAIPEVEFLMLLLLAFNAYIRIPENGMPTRKIFQLAISNVLFFFALLAKETAITLILIILAYDLTRRGLFFLKIGYQSYLAYIVTAMVYMAFRTNAIGGIVWRNKFDITVSDAVLNVLTMSLRYVGKLLIPINLSIVYSIEPAHEFFTFLALLATVAIFFYFVLLGLLWGRSPVAFFSLLWIAIPLLPVLYSPVVSVGGFADRYLYMPSAGFSMLFAFTVHSVIANKMSWRLVTAVYLIVAVCYITLTVQRGFSFKNGFTLWSQTIKQAPNSATVHGLLAQEFYDMGNVDKAIGLYREAIKLNPFQYTTHYNLAIAYTKANRQREAVDAYKNVIKVNPDYDRAYFNLANLYVKSGDLQKAISIYKEMIRIAPDNPNAHFNLGDAYITLKDWDRAAAAMESVIRLDSDNVKAFYNLAMIYHSNGYYKKAELYYKKTLKLNPGNLETLYNLASLYADMGQNRMAVLELKKILNVAPGHTLALKKINDLGFSKK